MVMIYIFTNKTTARPTKSHKYTSQEIKRAELWQQVWNAEWVFILSTSQLKI